MSSTWTIKRYGKTPVEMQRQSMAFLGSAYLPDAMRVQGPKPKRVLTVQARQSEAKAVRLACQLAQFSAMFLGY